MSEQDNLIQCPHCYKKTAKKDLEYHSFTCLMSAMYSNSSMYEYIKDKDFEDPPTRTKEGLFTQLDREQMGHEQRRLKRTPFKFQSEHWDDVLLYADTYRRTCPECGELFYYVEELDAPIKEHEDFHKHLGIGNFYGMEFVLKVVEKIKEERENNNVHIDTHTRRST